MSQISHSVPKIEDKLGPQSLKLPILNIPKNSVCT